MGVSAASPVGVRKPEWEANNGGGRREGRTGVRETAINCNFVQREREWETNGRKRWESRSNSRAEEGWEKAIEGGRVQRAHLTGGREKGYTLCPQG